MVRRAGVPLLLLLFFAGCRAAGVGSLAPPKTEVGLGQGIRVEEAIAKHNHNARLVKSLRASPSIRAVFDKHEYSVRGNLALERPRSFRLAISTPMGTQKEADIGSNETGYWFWTNQRGGRNQREYFVGAYDESGASALTAAYQPDWIIDALGLSELPTTGMKVERRQNTFVLISSQSSRNGWPITKVTTIDAKQGLVLRQELYQGNQVMDLRTKLAEAEVVGGKFQPVSYKSADGEAPGQVILPTAVKLVWLREALRLDVTLNQPEINPELTAALFEEPDFKVRQAQELCDAPH